jgi:hypothetical protein
MARSAVRGAFWALVAVGIVISASLLADTAAGPHTAGRATHRSPCINH